MTKLLEKKRDLFAKICLMMKIILVPNRIGNRELSYQVLL